MIVRSENSELAKLSVSSEHATNDRSLRRWLWLIWTLAVLGFSWLRWQFAADGATDVVGIVISTTLFGLVGLIVLTLIEMHFEPERFIDWHDERR